LEIWLPYGNTEIVLDIKAENLLEYINYKSSNRWDNDISRILDINHKDINICVLDDDNILIDLALRIRNAQSLQGINSTLYLQNTLRYKEYNAKSLNNIIYDKPNTILINKVSFDPIFGYGCVPSKIIRSSKDIMNDIISNLNEPRVGDKDAFSLVYKYLKPLESLSIEVIIHDNIITHAIIGDPIKCAEDAIKILDAYKIKCNRTKAIIVGSGFTLTLTDAIKALWNSINVVKKEGTIILLAEGSNGLGLELFNTISNKYTLNKEVMQLLAWASNNYDIGLVTAIPDYYLNNLHLRPFRSINQALNYILDKNSKQKVTVVHDASNIQLVSE
jgi:hypothetical protein